MTLFEIIIIAAMIGLNGLFACYEMALASVSHGRLTQLLHQNAKGAVAAVFMKERMEASLAVVQMGITLVGSLAAATGGASVQDSFAPYLQTALGVREMTSEVLAVAIMVVPLSIVTIIFAELVPKMFAIENKEWVCLKLSPLMALLARIAYPAVSVFERIVKGTMKRLQALFNKAYAAPESSTLHEFTAAVAVARTARLIGAREERILLSASQFPIRPISQIVIPAGEISMIPMNVSLAEALILAHLDMHTRFPVCEKADDPQTIRGYITFKDLVAAIKMNPSEPGLAGIMRSIKRFPMKEPIATTLEYMIREKAHIVLVENEAQEILGMVTLEDILEELVGEIEDEFDHLPAHVHATTAGWIMGGGVPMDTVASRTGAIIPDLPSTGRAPTLAEWSVSALGRSVGKGETFQANGLQVTVRKLRRRKISEAFVSRSNPPNT